MEQAVRLISSSGENFIKSASSFELDVKERLKWTKEKWNSTGEAGTRINRLCNSMHYWKSKLKPAVESTSIVITLFNRVKDVKMNFVDIIQSVEMLDKSFVVKGFADFRNPRYLCLYFENEEIRNEVLEKFCMVGDNYVVFLSWALGGEVKASFLKVHWLPMTLNTDIIKKALDKYVDCIEEQRKIFKFMSGREMPSGKISFKVVFKKDVSAEAIPHIMNIGDMEALITVSGRKPLCLNCDMLGHISKECKLRFCYVCRKLMARDHTCAPDINSGSYADMVKMGVGEEKLIEPEDWGSEIVFEDQSQKLKSQLAERIAQIENKIMFKNDIQTSCAQSAFQLNLNTERVEINNDEDELSSVDSSEDASGEMSVGNDFESTQEPQRGTVDMRNKQSEKFKKEIKQKRKKRSAKKKVNSLTINAQKEKIIAQNLKKTESLEDKNIVRCYGKPLLNNPRKQREKDYFDKVVAKSPESREYIFTD